MVKKDEKLQLRKYFSEIVILSIISCKDAQKEVTMMNDRTKLYLCVQSKRSE